MAEVSAAREVEVSRRGEGAREAREVSAAREEREVSGEVSVSEVSVSAALGG